ncbi:30S ribosomal protein S9, mitochondrial [Tanacetum coccineum]
MDVVNVNFDILAKIYLVMLKIQDDDDVTKSWDSLAGGGGNAFEVRLEMNSTSVHSCLTYLLREVLSDEVYTSLMLCIIIGDTGVEEAGKILDKIQEEDDMLDSLMALKNLDDKQEEIANPRVRQVDSQGRAYGTGKRKCSIARVWIEPGEGKFLINDNEFDVYFPMLDQRAALLRPLTETKTLGLLDINCTVKGGGV